MDCDRLLCDVSYVQTIDIIADIFSSPIRANMHSTKLVPNFAPKNLSPNVCNFMISVSTFEMSVLHFWVTWGFQPWLKVEYSSQGTKGWGPVIEVKPMGSYVQFIFQGWLSWLEGDRVYFCCNVKARGFLSVMSVCISIFFISHFWSYIERSIKVYGLKCQKIMPYRQHAAFYNFLNSECEYRLIVHNHSLCCKWGSEVV